MKHRSPWWWIPTTYIAEGLPYFAVNTLSVLVYHKMGIGLAEMAFFTGWLYLPWVIKPFWSPFIDLFNTNIGFSYIDTHLLLAYRLLFSHTRYICRRILHDRIVCP